MEEKEIQEENANVHKKNFKSMLNRSKLSSYLSFVGVIALIIVLSFWSVGWNPEKVGWRTFIVNLAFLVFLGIYGLFFGETTGTTFYKNNVVGAYQVARDSFLALLEEIKKKHFTDSLPQYIPYRYKLDCEDTYEKKLLSVKLFSKDILDLTDYEIELLKEKPYKKVWDSGRLKGQVSYFSKLSEKQYNVVMAIRTGEIEVDYIEDYNYYLMDGESDGVQQVTKAKNAEKRKLKISAKQKISKILLIIVMSVIFAGVTKNVIDGDQTAEAIMTMITRITTLVTSVFCGINTARLTNKVDIEVYRYKVAYLSVFYSCMENHTFKPKSYEELAKEEYDKYENEVIMNIETERVDKGEEDGEEIEEDNNLRSE